MVVGLMRFIRGLAAAREAGPDAQLLARFAARRDESAFAALVQRHGAMVLGVCRRVLDDAADAEDAFQATFLVLARKAASVRRQASVASWLYGVAYRTALKAKAAAARRRAAEREGSTVGAAGPDPALEALWRDLRPVLDEEVARLPQKNRAAVVLCYLEGKTTEEAAALLGCPRGTVLSRLAWARERLRTRLTRRGVTLSSGALAAAVSRGAEAAPPPALVNSTAHAAARFAGGNGAAAGVSPAAAALTEGVLRAMRMTRLRGVIAGLLLAASLLAAGSGFLLGDFQAGEKDTKNGQAAPPAAGEKDTRKGQPAPPAKEAAAPAKGPVTKANAHEVTTAFLQNDALADEKFAGKRVRVHGVVVRVRRSDATSVAGEPVAYWLLMGGEFRAGKEKDGKVPFVMPASKMHLAFEFVGKEARKRLAELQPGTLVTVEGKCEGVRMPVGREKAIMFRECTLVQVPQPPEDTPKEFLKKLPKE
jgi:RNA polymerase sigma factor (sigma-70 family)